MAEPIDAQAPSAKPDVEAESPSKRLISEMSDRLSGAGAVKVSREGVEGAFVVVSSPDGNTHLALIVQRDNPNSDPNPDNEKFMLHWLDEERGIIGKFETRPPRNQTHRFGKKGSRQADWEHQAFENRVNSWKKTGGILYVGVFYGNAASNKELRELADIVKNGGVDVNLMQAATSYYQSNGGTQVLPPVQPIKS